VQRIEPRDACHKKAAIVLAHTVRKSTAIDVSHHEAAEYEEHIDGEVALADEIAVRRDVEIWEELRSPTVMIKDDPKRGDSPQRRQRRKLVGRAGSNA
jgi:hypothetical protein